MTDEERWALITEAVKQDLPDFNSMAHYGVPDWLRNIQINAAIEGGPKGKGYEIGGGGRLGYTVPLDNDSAVTLGVSGGGGAYKVKTPNKVFQGKQLNLNGVDAQYQRGNHNFSASFNKVPELLNPKKFDKRFQVNYDYSF